MELKKSREGYMRGFGGGKGKAAKLSLKSQNLKTYASYVTHLRTGGWNWKKALMSRPSWCRKLASKHWFGSFSASRGQFLWAQREQVYYPPRIPLQPPSPLCLQPFVVMSIRTIDDKAVCWEVGRMWGLSFLPIFGPEKPHLSMAMSMGGISSIVYSTFPSYLYLNHNPLQGSVNVPTSLGKVFSLNKEKTSWQNAAFQCLCLYLSHYFIQTIYF